MTLLLASDGETLAGIWSGTDRRGQIIQGKTIWVNTHSALRSILSSSVDSIADLADKYLDMIENPWRASDTVTASGSNLKLVAYRAGMIATRRVAGKSLGR